MQFSNQRWSIEIKRKCNSKCKIHIWVPLDESPVISYADGPGPAVSNRAICLCFWPKLNDAAVGFCETTIFLYPTIKSTPLWLKLRQNDICGQRFIPTTKYECKRLFGILSIYMTGKWISNTTNYGKMKWNNPRHKLNQKKLYQNFLRNWKWIYSFSAHFY